MKLLLFCFLSFALSVANYYYTFGTLNVFASTTSIPAQGGDRQDCWGKDTRCPDGKFRDYQGKEQPETCNNNHDNAHPCECAIATTDGDHCPAGGLNPANHDMGPNCSTYCRTEACKCVNQCDFDGSK
jgi:hypothetical protein